MWQSLLYMIFIIKLKKELWQVLSMHWSGFSAHSVCAPAATAHTQNATQPLRGMVSVRINRWGAHWVRAKVARALTEYAPKPLKRILSDMSSEHTQWAPKWLLLGLIVRLSGFSASTSPRGFTGYAVHTKSAAACTECAPKPLGASTEYAPRPPYLPHFRSNQKTFFLKNIHFSFENYN